MCRPADERSPYRFLGHIYLLEWHYCKQQDDIVHLERLYKY